MIATVPAIITVKVPGVTDFKFDVLMKRLSVWPVDNNEVRLANALLERGVTLREVHSHLEPSSLLHDAVSDIIAKIEGPSA